MSSYIDDENDNSLENSMFLVKKRNSGIERILKKYDINSRNRQNKDLKNFSPFFNQMKVSTQKYSGIGIQVMIKCLKIQILLKKDIIRFKL
jgi:hypothetical protein